MQKVLQWEKGIEEYLSEFKKLQIKRPQNCERCGCTKFHKWGTYERFVIEENAEHRISIQRFYCIKCEQTCSSLPSFCVSGVCYSLDFIIKFLRVLILKISFELDELKRQAYAFLKRFVQSENLILAYLRSRGFGEFPEAKKERTMKIFTALLEIHKRGNLLFDFFQETNRHFMSINKGVSCNFSRKKSFQHGLTL